MKLSKKVKIRHRRQRLSTRVERSTTPEQPPRTLDGLDEDVLAHVNHFFSTPLPKMEKISLLTPEDARAALVTIERTQQILEERIHAARVLKTLCENAKKEENIV